MSEDEQPPWMDQPGPAAQKATSASRTAQDARQASQGHQDRPRAMTAQQERQERASTTYQAVGAIMRDQGGAEAKAIKAMLGGSKAAFDRYVATVFSLLATKPEVLEQATPASIVNAVRVAAGMGLEPLTSDGGIVVYGSTATFMPQWQGYLKRIRNSGKVRDIDVQVVYENDTWERGYSQDGAWFKHGIGDGDRGGYKLFYAYAVMPSGFVYLEEMTAAEVDQVRDTFARGLDKRDRDGNLTSPWRTSYAEMARKTVIRRLAKRLPQEAVQALELADEAAQELEARMAEQANQLAATRSEVATVREMALIGAGQVSPGSPESAQEGQGGQEAPEVAQ